MFGLMAIAVLIGMSLDTATQRRARPKRQWNVNDSGRQALQHDRQPEAATLVCRRCGAPV